jgi:glycine cleavage system transcriptional repressor
MSEYTVSIVGEDRPGIVAAVTGALLGAGGNVENCRAAILAGSFAMVLAVEVPAWVTDQDIVDLLAPVASQMGLSLGVRPAPPAPAAAGRDRCVITIYGADRPGIVHGAAQALAAAGVNIVDLSSRLVGDPPIYVLGIEAEPPAGMSAGAVRDALRGPDLAGLDISVQSESERLL